MILTNQRVHEESIVDSYPRFYLPDFNSLLLRGNLINKLACQA
jgi:hypothetical protein